MLLKSETMTHIWIKYTKYNSQQVLVKTAFSLLQQITILLQMIENGAK